MECKSVECGVCSEEQAMRHVWSAGKLQLIFWKGVCKSIVQCHTKRLSTCYQTGLNVTKCHGLPRKTTLQLVLAPWNRIGFAASSIDTARPQETRDSRRYMLEHQNEHFVRDIPQFSHVAASKSTFSYEFSYELQNWLHQKRCFVRGVRQVFQHVSQNAMPATEFARCRHLTQPWQCDSQKTTQHRTSKVLRRPHKMTMDTSKVLRLPRKKLQRIFWKHGHCACHTKRLSTRYKTRLNVTKCHACHAKQATRRSKLPKVIPVAELAIGTAIRPSHGHFRTVADGCERLGNTPLTPRPPEWNGNPCYAFEKLHAVVARSTCRRVSDHFLKSGYGFAWQAQGILHLPKVSNMWGFCGSFKNAGMRWTFEEDLRRYISPQYKRHRSQVRVC